MPKHTIKISIPYLGRMVVVSVVSVSCAVSAYQVYQNTNIFSPSAMQSTTIKNNQIVFPGQDQQSLDQQNKTSEDYSKQKKDAKDQITPKNQSQSSFLFEQNNQILNNNNPNLPVNNPITGIQENNNVPTLDNNTLVVNPNGTNNVTNDSNSSTTILVPGDSNNTLDSLIPGNGQTNMGTGESNDYNNGSNSNANSGSNSNNGSNSNTGSGETPSNPTKPDSTSKYPDPVATLPDISSSLVYRHVISTSKTEFKNSDKTVQFDFVAKSMEDTIDIASTSKIYYGKELDAWTLLCNALFFVEEKDPNGKILNTYRLTNYNENFEIMDFPKVATKNFTVEFRFRPDSSQQWQRRTVNFVVEDNRIVFLDYNDQELTSYNLKDGKGDNEDGVINTNFSLRYFYKYYLNNGNSSEAVKTKKIFQGWSSTPNGEPVDENYVKNVKGKVILYPLEMIDVPNQYEVEFRHCFDQGDTVKYKYRYILTDIKYDNLKINEDIHLPNYIERIDLQNEHNYDHEGKLYLPESLEKISISSQTYTNYNDIIVDNNNPNMCSENGLVLNKDKTTVLYSIGSKILTIPSTVTKIETVSPKIKELHIEKPEKLNNIKALSQIESLNLVVDDQYYLDCYRRWYEDLPGELLNQEGQARPYEVVEGSILEEKDEQVVLVGVLASASGTLTVPDNVTRIENYAFSDNNKINLVVINNDDIEVGSYILKNSSVKDIYFLGQSAKIQSNTFDDADVNIQVSTDYIDSYKESWKMIDNQIAEHLQEFKYKYVVVNGFNCMEKAGYKDKWILLNAPSDIIEFKGDSVPGIEIVEIGENAFSACKNLQYVELDEHISKIGTGAFKECTSLEGVISFNTDHITIGDEAFNTNEYLKDSKLKSLVFNAKEATFEDDYVPDQSSSLLYAPYGSEGYPLMSNGNNNCRKYSFKYFVDNVYGGHIIYGETIGFAADGNAYAIPDQYYLVGATSRVSGDIETRNNIFEICNNAFANCPITSIQLHMTEGKYFIDGGAFYNTKLSGEFVLPDGLCEIGFTAFSKTQITRFVFPQYYANKDYLFDNQRINIGSMLFDETDTLKEIVFQSDEPINFTLYTRGSGFRFKSNDDDLKITFTGNAQGKEQEYYDAWKYGYVGVSNEDELSDLIDDNSFFYLMDYMWEDDFWDNYEYYSSLAIQQAQEEIDIELEGLKSWFGDALKQPEESNPSVESKPTETTPSNPGEEVDTPSEEDSSNGEENPSEDNDSKEDQEDNQDDITDQQSNDQIVENEGE